MHFIILGSSAGLEKVPGDSTIYWCMAETTERSGLARSCCYRWKRCLSVKNRIHG